MGNKLVGRNALVYIGTTTEIPQRNQVTVNFTRELSEARVFQAPVAGNYWSEQIVGFTGWTVNINGYYDDSDNAALAFVADGAAKLIVIYESRSQPSRYWYGSAIFNSVSEDIGVDDVIGLNLSGTGHGPLYRAG